MRFSDIPIRGFRIEVDHWALGQFVLERFQEKFGTEQILDVDSKKYPGEYDVVVRVKEETSEIQDFLKHCNCPEEFLNIILSDAD